MSIDVQIFLYLILIIIVVFLLSLLVYFIDKNNRMKKNVKDSKTKSDDDLDEKEDKLQKVIDREVPDKVLVPDNVKKESQLESTQDEDAPEYKIKK